MLIDFMSQLQVPNQLQSQLKTMLTLKVIYKCRTLQVPSYALMKDIVIHDFFE